ncbi:capsid protein [Mycobacterium gordonae]|uniref:Capsid protein n=1 Tax=Mycobacterium gordonae TaxID=1778 RepID=A0A0Q2LTW6_MYCGO|nr:capsid protein [Mycobacterium gordonae]
MPRIASGASAGFYAAGAQISESNASFDEVQLLPSSLKGIKSLTKVSNELIRQATHTVGALDTVLSTRLVTDVSNVLDAALYDGTGASDTIKGILRQTGITTGTLDLTEVDSLIDGLAAAQGNHVAPTHWVMTPASFAAIRKVKVGSDDNRYVIEPNTIQNGVNFQLLGLPVIITDYIPAASAKKRVALVDFSKVALSANLG